MAYKSKLDVIIEDSYADPEVARFASLDEAMHGAAEHLAKLIGPIQIEASTEVQVETAA